MRIAGVWRRVRVGGVGLTGVLAGVLLAGCAAITTNGQVVRGAPGPAPTPTLAAAPPAQPPPLLTQAKVDGAVAKLDGVVRDTMAKTGVPGVAVAVVYRDKVVYLKGFGVRKVGAPGEVGADTVFQIASLSKPVSSTVVAGVVGQRGVGWDDPVAKYDPGFALKDPWVSGHVSIADLFSHRSGLPDHAGDLLEGLGFDRDYILAHLALEPLTPFRASYAYTNFGLTEAALAVAKAKGVSWPDLAAGVLYRPLGMKSTSSVFADYAKAADRAFTHVKVGDAWAAKYVRDPDAQSPAGGVSSTVRDLAQWMRLQLGGGSVDGRRIVDAESLAQTHLPHIVATPPMSPAGRSGFYGLGWNVSYDDFARLRLNHSGAFELGAATTVTLLPGEQLGIVVLSNAAPVGAVEAIAFDFLDLAQEGRPTVAWLDLLGKVFTQMEQGDESKTDYAKPPAGAVPARPAQTYVGTYRSDYYGPLTVVEESGDLVMVLGPKSMRFPLTHYAGDVFSYRTVGENAVGLSGVTFTVDVKGAVTGVRIEDLDKTGLGTFSRRPIAAPR